MAEPNARIPPSKVAAQLSPLSPPEANGAAGTVSSAGKPLAKPRVQPRPAEMKDGFREIVETIVFVVVLVLMLKSFVAEAFVIPTGSMAETLYGYQKLVTCPKCHYEFPVNCSSEVDPQQGPPTPVVGCTCPNCRYHIEFAKEDMDPSWHTGDRVLVGKFLYDLQALGLEGPKRHDVVVFKYPMEPQKGQVPMNYIKRLIGLPGETIAIHYGKVYVLEDQKYNDGNVPPLELWQKRYMHEDDPEAQRLYREHKFRMLRKSPPQMLAVRRLVFDNEHQPKDLIGKVPPRWQAEAQTQAWKADNTTEPKRFQHSAGQDKETAWLRYHNLIPDFARLTARPELITDFMGYNTWEEQRGIGHHTPAQDWVGDLMLETEVQVDQAQGELTLELSKGVDRFQARWDLTTGLCTLVRITGDKETKLESAETALKKPGKYRLRFANFDNRLTVWVDSALPFGDGWNYEAPGLRGPRRENDLQPAGIGVRGAGVSVGQLKLWRDTYYTVNVGNMSDSGINSVDFAKPETWDPLQDLPVKTLYVQPNHFLCMGDNSRESSDGRSWGAVPKRLMLGRALLIYYPLGGRAGRIE
jgi:signal peptidase I